MSDERMPKKIIDGIQKGIYWLKEVKDLIDDTSLGVAVVTDILESVCMNTRVAIEQRPREHL